MICDELCWNLLSPKRSDLIQWKWGVVFSRERDFADKRARIQCISCTQSRISPSRNAGLGQTKVMNMVNS